MRIQLVLVAVLCTACPKSGGPTVDPLLPEEAVTIDVQGPLTILRDATEDLDPSARARSLALLVQHADDATVAWAPRALFDPEPWVQRGAVEALAMRLPDADAEALLEAYVVRSSADPYVRAWAAARLPSPSTDTIAALSAAWREQTDPWTVAPLALAAAAVGDTDAVPALSDALATGELALETGFLLQIGDSGHTSLIDSLQVAQDLVEIEMELPVATARLMLGDVSGEQPLRKAVADSDAEWRLEALDYLAHLDHPTATTLLRRASTQGPDLVRWYADLALAARLDGKSDVFASGYDEIDPEVRVLAVRFAAEAAMHGTANRREARVTHGVIAAALSDSDAAVRAEALRAVGRLKLAEVGALVQGLLVDEAKRVRIEAAGAALTIGVQSEAG